MGFVVPLPFLLRWAILFLLHQQQHKSSNSSSTELKAIESGKKRNSFQGQPLSHENKSDESHRADHVNAITTFVQKPYKNKKYAIHWESVIEFRRLVLCLLQLVYFEQIRLVLVIVICAVFLVHHVAIYPYISIHANRAEAFSLFLLQFVAVCNFMKCLMKDINVFSSHTLDLYNILYSMEVLMPIVLILFICGIEIIVKLTQVKKVKQLFKVVWHRLFLIAYRDFGSVQ